MGDLLAIVSKPIFEQDREWSVGEVYDTAEYVSKHKALAPLGEGGTLFLVTVRPPDESLWLVAVLERPVFVGDRWTAQMNTVPIVDITELAERFVLETGTGIKAKPGALGMTLQTPRRLAASDVELLRTVAKPRAPAKSTQPPRRR